MHRFLKMALSFCFLAFAPAMTVAAPADDAANVLTSWEKAFNAGNPDNTAAIYTNDATFFGTISPNVTSGTAGLKAYFEIAAKNGFQVKLVDAPAVVRLSDNAFALAGIYEFTGKRPDGQTFTAPARYSFVVVNADGQWRIAHHHSSPRPQPQPH